MKIFFLAISIMAWSTSTTSGLMFTLPGSVILSGARKIIGLEDIKNAITKAIVKAFSINFIRATAVTAQLMRQSRTRKIIQKLVQIANQINRPNNGGVLPMIKNDIAKSLIRQMVIANVAKNALRSAKKIIAKNEVTSSNNASSVDKHVNLQSAKDANTKPFDNDDSKLSADPKTKVKTTKKTNKIMSKQSASNADSEKVSNSTKMSSITQKPKIGAARKFYDPNNVKTKSALFITNDIKPQIINGLKLEKQNETALSGNHFHAGNTKIQKSVSKEKNALLTILSQATKQFKSNSNKKLSNADLTHPKSDKINNLKLLTKANLTKSKFSKPTVKHVAKIVSKLLRKEPIYDPTSKEIISSINRLKLAANLPEINKATNVPPSVKHLRQTNAKSAKQITDSKHKSTQTSKTGNKIIPQVNATKVKNSNPLSNKSIIKLASAIKKAIEIKIKNTKPVSKPIYKLKSAIRTLTAIKIKKGQGIKKDVPSTKLINKPASAWKNVNAAKIKNRKLVKKPVVPKKSIHKLTSAIKKFFQTKPITKPMNKLKSAVKKMNATKIKNSQKETKHVPFTKPLNKPSSAVRKLNATQIKNSKPVSIPIHFKKSIKKVNVTKNATNPVAPRKIINATKIKNSKSVTNHIPLKKSMKKVTATKNKNGQSLAKHVPSTKSLNKSISAKRKNNATLNTNSKPVGKTVSLTKLPSASTKVNATKVQNSKPIPSVKSINKSKSASSSNNIRSKSSIQKSDTPPSENIANDSKNASANKASTAKSTPKSKKPTKKPAGLLNVVGSLVGGIFHIL